MQDLLYLHDARDDMNKSSSTMAKFSREESSLKGLLMDKGQHGLNEKIRELLRKFTQVQIAMESLVEQQRFSRENSGCDCLDLYLALNLKTGRDRTEADKIKQLSVAEIQLHHTKSVPALEWRARKSFASSYGYATTYRIHAFNPNHNHFHEVREYIAKTKGDYYEVLAGYDAVRISLNYTIKHLRKTILELTLLSEETQYSKDIEHGAENIARRIFKGLPDSEQIARLINRLYC